MAEFDGLSAIVTGGSSGIGAAAIAVLRERGATVASLDRSPGAADADLAVACDVTDAGAVDAAVAQVVERFGGVDVLVNNAGIGAAGDVSANDDDEWHRVLDVNVVGLARVARAVLPQLRRSQHAAIVNTGSVAGQIGLPNRALYSASKGAVSALTLAMAADHVREGIRVNAVLPGTTDTPWVGRLLDAAADPGVARDALEARQPIQRLIRADEVATSIAFLAGPRSGSTTGTLLLVDGGLTNLRLPT